MKRLDLFDMSKGWKPSPEEIIAGFINDLGFHEPELKRQIIEYTQRRVQELEGKPT